MDNDNVNYVEHIEIYLLKQQSFDNQFDLSKLTISANLIM